MEAEKRQLLEVQRLQQETVDLIVHDLRNPLHVIINALGVLNMSVPETVLNENQELLNLVTQTTDRMVRLIDSILDVSRIEAGQAQLSPTPTDLADLMRTAVQRVSYLLAKHSLDVTVDAPDLPDLLLDADMIDRVVANLIDNAIKFTPNHGHIHLSTELGDDHVRVRVADTGRGIPADQRERFFDRFVQVDGDQPRTRGFGLGLTFCRLAILAHGGRIWVEDGVQGVGSQFVFTLPARWAI